MIRIGKAVTDSRPTIPTRFVVVMVVQWLIGLGLIGGFAYAAYRILLHFGIL